MLIMLLPPEIMLEILKYSTSSLIRERNLTLKSIRLASKTLNSLATPFLFEEIRVYPWMSSVQKAESASRSFGHHTKSIVVCLKAQMLMPIHVFLCGLKRFDKKGNMLPCTESDIDLHYSEKQAQHTYEAYEQHYGKHGSLAMWPNELFILLGRILGGLPHLRKAVFDNNTGHYLVNNRRRQRNCEIPMACHTTDSCLWPEGCAKVDDMHNQYNMGPILTGRDPVDMAHMIVTLLTTSPCNLQGLSFLEGPSAPFSFFDLHHIDKRNFDHITSVVTPLTQLEIEIHGPACQSIISGEDKKAYHTAKALQAARRLKHLSLAIEAGQQDTSSFQLILSNWSMPFLETLTIRSGVSTAKMLIDFLRTLKALRKLNLWGWTLTKGYWSRIIKVIRDEHIISRGRNLVIESPAGGFPDGFSDVEFDYDLGLIREYFAGKGPNPFGKKGLEEYEIRLTNEDEWLDISDEET